MKKSVIKKFLLVIFTLNFFLTSILAPISSPISPTQVQAANSCTGTSSTGGGNPVSAAQVGGVALDQAATFLANMDDVTGAYYDQTRDRIVFVGKRNTVLPEFDKDDLATAIRAIFFKKTIPAVSIELSAPENEMMDVKYYGGIENTKFGKVLFDADYALKHFAWGYDQNGNRINTTVAGYKPIMERYNDKNPTASSSGIYRLWINPQEVIAKLDSSSNSFVFDSVSMQVSFNPLSSNNDPLLNDAGQEFATHTTQHYDDFANEISSWADAKQLAKIVGVVKWLSDNAIATDFHWAADYSPAYVDTPEQILTESITKNYNGYQYTETGGVIYDQGNDYLPANGSATTLKNDSEAVNASKEEVHWTFTSNGQQYESVAVAADAFRSLGAYTTSVTDMSFPTIGSQDLEFVRSYSSFSNGQKGIGRGWSFIPAQLVDNKPVPNGFFLSACAQTQGDFFKRKYLALTYNGFRETFTYDYLQGSCGYFVDESYLHTSITANITNSPTVQYTATLKDQTQLVFEEYWNGTIIQPISWYSFRLVYIKDKNGNKINYSYDTQNRVTSISDDNNHSLTLTYNSNNLISQLSDWGNRTIYYTYNDQGDLLTVTDPRGNITAYTYYDNHKLATITDREGNVILTNTYTTEGKIATQTSGAGAINTHTYDEANRTITVSDNLGRTEKVDYDDKARILKQTDAYNFSKEYTYGIEYSPLTIKDKNGNILNTTYDAKGNITSVTYPDNKKIMYEYNDKNLVTKITDERYGSTPKETTFTYDANGNPTYVNEAGRTTTFAYYSNGKLHGMWDSLNHLTYWGYNSFGNKTIEVNADNKMSYYYYDALGRLYWQTDASSKSAAFAYDANNNLTGKWDAAGTPQETFTWNIFDDENRPKITVLPNVTSILYTYNSASSLASVIDQANNTTSYNYDQYQNLSSKQDALERTTQYEYDQLNRRTKSTTPLGKATQWEYDPNGNITKRIDASNQQTTYEYDNLNRLKKINYPNATSITRTYDNRGNLLTMVDPSGTTTYEYDGFDRLTKVTDPNNEIINYEYDNADNLTRIIYPGNKAVAHTYDAANRLASVTDWNNKQTSYQYNDNGTLKTKIIPNGITTSYNYDNANRLIDVTHTRDQSTLAQFAYQRDAIGNITKATESGAINYPTPTPPQNGSYTAQYFDNQDLTGNPVLTRNDPQINFDWGGDSPDPLIPVDHFSARWTKTQSFTAGTYQFSATADDGVRLYVDNDLIIDQWIDQGATTYTADKTLTAGDHIIKMEYYENGGGAVAEFSYQEAILPAVSYTVYDDNLNGGWYDWSWSSTNNFSDIHPYLGNNNISWTADSGWAGLFLHKDGGINTTGYTTLTLAIKATQAGQWAPQVQLYDSNDQPIESTRDLYDYNGEPSADSYKVYTVPLSDIGGSNRVINAILIQDITGAAAPAMYIDEIKLTGDGSVAFNGEYFDNQDLSGSPVLTRNDPQINFDWGGDSPDPLIPVDHFSARWTKTQSFTAGTYRFTATADDGVRVYIDNELIIDQWIDQGATTYTADRTLTAGDHIIKMEYYENGGGAVASLNYQQIASSGIFNQLFASTGFTTLSDLFTIPTATAQTPENSFTIDYTYDILGRLTKSQNAVPLVHEYTYDKVGNMLTSKKDTQESIYSYNIDNQLTQKDSTTFTYDNNGNQTARGDKAINYDFEDRLTAYNDPSAPDTSYVYDGANNRLSEKVDGSTRIQYVNDVSGDLTNVLIAKNLQNSTENYYLYGNNLISQGGVSEANRQYYLEDGLGNIRFVADNTGNIIETYSYDPYGNQLAGGNTANFQFKGEQSDISTGLYYMRARYYDPATGRFISKDPIKGYLQDPRTQNGYDYGLNNPVNLSDPSGLEVNGKCISCSAGILGYSYTKTACAVETSSGEKGFTLSNTNSGVLFFKNGIEYSEYYNPSANTLNDLKGESNEFGISIFNPGASIETEPKTNKIQGYSKSIGWGIDWPVEIDGGSSNTNVYTNFKDLINDLF